MQADYVGWVLRNARSHAREPALRTARRLADGDERVRRVHPAQVSRWENGVSEVTREIVRRYETLLGLPEGQLLAAIGCLDREAEPVRVVPTLPPAEPPDAQEVHDLVELALTDAPMTGVQWERLTSHLGRMPNVFMRTDDWTRLIGRCEQELSVALGLEYALRDEAVARLAGHPRSGAAVARMIEQVLNDPAAQVYSDAAGLAQFSPDPRVAAVLVDHLRHPTNHDSHRAAMGALATMVGRDDLGAARGDIARLALAALRDTTAPFRVHRAAANLLKALDVPGRNRIAMALSSDDRRHAASILMDGPPTGADALRAVKARIHATIQQHVTRGDRTEPVLTRLIHTATAVSSDQPRSHALMVLALSPQGPAIGRVYAAELASAMASGDAVAAHECLSVLSFLRQPEDLDVFTEIALAPRTSASLAMEASIVIGNCKEPASGERELREKRCFSAALELLAAGSTRGAAYDSAGDSDDADGFRQRLRGLTYVLGMRGRFDLLEQLADSVEDDSPARPMVTWWLELPSCAKELVRVQSA